MSAPRQKIIFLTNSDYGQANVVLSITYALVQAAPDVEIHIASQSRLKEPIARLIKQVAVDIGSAAADSIKFHQVVGLSHFDSIDRPGNPTIQDWLRPPNVLNMTRHMVNLAGLSLPWDPEEFMEIYRDVERIWNHVKPDVTVAEAFFAPAVTFCHRVKTNWIVLAPNTIKEFALPLQPKLAMLWKFPVICSSFQFPVPLHQVPLNIFYNIIAGVNLALTPRYKRVAAHVKATIGPDTEVLTLNELGLLKAPPEGLRILVANSPDIDFPFDVMPKAITPCGPITRATLPISTEDPELAIWLSRGPTIYMNLGTHHYYDVALAREVALAFRRVLDLAQGSSIVGQGSLQILWKMPRKASNGDNTDPSSLDFLGPWEEIKSILSPEMDRDQVRIVNWIVAEPKSVLESGNVVVSVNHGGSNSFHEALCTGIPQVNLPGWGDCFDFALRSELLGIGKWGNRKAKPWWERNELAEAMEEVLLGEKSNEIRQQAMEVGRRHPEGAGRMKAASEILGLLEGPRVKA